MKDKNYKSAIHNFAHSFMSVDYTRSGHLALNSVIELYNAGKETKAIFDFINKDIQPDEAISPSSVQLLNDYLNWLPEHLESHNCDLFKLEKLELIIWTEFHKAITPEGMKDTIEFEVNIEGKWKLYDREEQSVSISNIELMKESFLKSKIPELK